MRLPRLLFICRFFFVLFYFGFFFSFSHGWLKNGRQGGVSLRLDKGAKKKARHLMVYYELNYSSFFYFLDLIIFQ